MKDKELEKRIDETIKLANDFIQDDLIELLEDVVKRIESLEWYCNQIGQYGIDWE